MPQFVKKIIAACLILLTTMPVLAHGVRIEHTIDPVSGEMTVSAAFDTGEVLDNAAVIIFAPDDLINPWSTGTMDENGVYTFMPDYDIEGFWDVQVRKAGHGGLVNVELSSDMMPDPDAAPVTTTDDSTTRITLSDDSQVVISGDVPFTVTGDTVVFETDTSAEIPATQSAAVAQRSSGFTTEQIIIMSLSVIWGFVGTALYFMRRKPKSSA